MDGQVALDTGALVWARSRIVGAHDELSSRHDDVQQHARSLLGGGWSGAAADQYAEAWGRWQVAAEQVLASMLELCAAMTMAEVGLVIADLEAVVATGRVEARLAGAVR